MLFERNSNFGWKDKSLPLIGRHDSSYISIVRNPSVITQAHPCPSIFLSLFLRSRSQIVYIHSPYVSVSRQSVCLSVQDFTFKSARILIVRAKTGIFKTVFGDVKPLCELGYFFCLSVWKYLFTYILSLFVLDQSATLPACCLMSATAVLLVPLIPYLANLWNLCEMPLFVIKR